MRRMWAASAAVLMCLTLGGLPVAAQAPSAGAVAAGGAPVGPVTIGFANFGTGYWYLDAVGNGVRQAATAAGVRLLAAGGGWSGYVQGTQIEDFVKQGVDAILVLPWDPAAIVPAVRVANAAGIPVLAVDRTVDGVAITSLIAADGVAGSRTAGEYLFKAMGGSGKVIEIQGDPSWAKPRTEGFQQVLDATPSITLAGQRSAGGDGDVAESATAILLKENPDVAGVFAHTDDMALGAAKAIAHAGLTDKVKVVGLDGSPYGLVGVKDGALAATVAQQVLLMGRTALETAIKVAAGEKVDAFVPVDMVLVTRDNVERFLAPVSAAAPGQSPAAAPAALPVVVSGTEMCDNRSNGETMPLPAGLTGGQRMVATCIDTMSDPRVSGAYVNTLAYECVGGTTACTYWGTHVLEGPDGGWDCSWTAVDFPPLSNAIIGVCPGTGGYEGMSYVFQHTSLDFGDGTSFRGVIYEGLPPAWPPMPSTASAASPAPSQ